MEGMQKNEGPRTFLLEMLIKKGYELEQAGQFLQTMLYQRHGASPELAQAMCSVFPLKADSDASQAEYMAGTYQMSAGELAKAACTELVKGCVMDAKGLLHQATALASPANEKNIRLVMTQLPLVKKVLTQSQTDLGDLVAKYNPAIQNSGNYQAHLST